MEVDPPSVIQQGVTLAAYCTWLSLVAGSTRYRASSVALGGSNCIFCCCNTEGQLLINSVPRWQHRYERGALAMGATSTAQFCAL